MAFRNAADYLAVNHPNLFNYANPKLTIPHELVVAGDTWTACGGTWTISVGNGYTQGTGALWTYTGEDSVAAWFAGIASITVLTAATIAFGLFVEDVLVVETTSLFDVQNKTGSISDQDLFALSQNEEITFKVKSSVGNTITFNSMKLLLI